MEMDGNTWFRFLEPAGTKLSNTPLDDWPLNRTCGTCTYGRLDGSDPTIVGQIVDRKVCFDKYADCWESVNIKVSLCKDNNNEEFLVYQLKTYPRNCCCDWAYCAE